VNKIGEKPARILIVEDNRMERRLLSDRTAKIGHLVVGAVSEPGEALAAAESQKPDLALVDIVMPGPLSGVDVAQRLKSQYNIPIIFVTAYADDEILDQAQAVAPDGYLIKPFSVRLLAVTIRLALVRTEADRRRREAEAEIAASQKRLGQIINFLPDAAFVIDNSGRVLFWNKAMEDMTGVPAGEMVGKSDYEYAVPFYGQRRPVLIDLTQGPDEQTEDQYLYVQREGDVLVSETYDPPFKPGAYLWNRARLLHDAQGEVIGAIETVRDVTQDRLAARALEQTNRRLTFIHEHAPAMLHAADADGRLVEVSGYWLRVMGYSREEVIGRRADDFFTDQSRRLAREKVWPQLLTTGRCHEQHFRMVAKKGRVLDVLLSAVIERDEDGRVLGSLATIADITRQKQAEARLEAALQEKEVLLREIHHRVKNNMQIINSLLRLQSRKLSAPDLLAVFQESQNRIMTMALIHETLYQGDDMSRVEFSAYLRRLTDVLARAYRMDNPGVKVEVVAGPVMLDLDAAAPIGLIVNELVTNSFKHAFPGDRAGTIRVELTASSDEVTLVVADDGAGLGPDFDPADLDSLGLSLVKGLAEDQLEGRLTVQSDNGARFVVVFPRPVARPSAT
jgi:PAS domain S-box-containing protein